MCQCSRFSIPTMFQPITDLNYIIPIIATRDESIKKCQPIFKLMNMLELMFNRYIQPFTFQINYKVSSNFRIQFVCCIHYQITRKSIKYYNIGSSSNFVMCVWMVVNVTISYRNIYVNIRSYTIYRRKIVLTRHNYANLHNLLFVISIKVVLEYTSRCFSQQLTFHSFYKA